MVLDMENKNSKTTVKVGTLVYHCAPGGVMIPWHVVMGMNGAIMVLPREGLNDGDGNRLSYDKA
jgi:nitrite reductase (NO-forming)